MYAALCFRSLISLNNLCKVSWPRQLVRRRRNLLQEIGIRTLNILTESGIYTVYFQDSIEKRGMSGDSRALWIWISSRQGPSHRGPIRKLVRRHPSTQRRYTAPDSSKIKRCPTTSIFPHVNKVIPAFGDIRDIRSLTHSEHDLARSLTPAQIDWSTI